MYKEQSQVQLLIVIYSPVTPLNSTNFSFPGCVKKGKVFQLETKENPGKCASKELQQ